MTWLDWIIVVIPLLVVLFHRACLCSSRSHSWPLCDLRKDNHHDKKALRRCRDRNPVRRYISAEYFAVVNGKHQPVMLTVRKKTDGKKEIRE